MLNDLDTSIVGSATKCVPAIKFGCFDTASSSSSTRHLTISRSSQASVVRTCATVVIESNGINIAFLDEIFDDVKVPSKQAPCRSLRLSGWTSSVLHHTCANTWIRTCGIIAYGCFLSLTYTTYYIIKRTSTATASSLHVQYQGWKKWWELIHLFCGRSWCVCVSCRNG